jgi:hypothetical protein
MNQSQWKRSSSTSQGVVSMGQDSSSYSLCAAFSSAVFYRNTTRTECCCFSETESPTVYLLMGGCEFLTPVDYVIFLFFRAPRLSFEAEQSCRTRRSNTIGNQSINRDCVSRRSINATLLLRAILCLNDLYTGMLPIPAEG